MIDISGLDFSYKESDFRLKIDELKIGSNKAAAVIGPSGCGKTTLMHLIAGILPSQEGSIVIDNKRINELTDSQRRLFRIQRIGFIFQDFALLDYLTLYENIIHSYRINPALQLTSRVRKRAKDLAQSLGITKRLKGYVNKTSQGEQQRAAICRALLNEPAVILADEPTGNLDPVNKKAIVEILLNYIKTHKATLVVATHDYELLDSFQEVIDFRRLVR